MKTISFITLTLLIVILTDSSPGQVVQVLDKKLPSVYLVYERISDERLENNKNADIVLRLHNNTSVSINVSANFDTNSASAIEDGTFELFDGSRGTLLKPGSEVELCYDAEGLFVQKGYSRPKKKSNPEVTDLRNSCSYRSNGKGVDEPHSMGYWIRSKEFIRFKVPRQLLNEDLKVYTEFSYPWEFENGRLKRNEPKHRVYFFFFDVPTASANVDRTGK